MKHYIPTNKTTGVQYPPITEEVKTAYEADPHLRGKYTFRETEANAPEKTIPKPTESKKKETPAPAPIEARAVNANPETE